MQMSGGKTATADHHFGSGPELKLRWWTQTLPRLEKKDEYFRFRLRFKFEFELNDCFSPNYLSSDLEKVGWTAEWQWWKTVAELTFDHSTDFSQIGRMINRRQNSPLIAIKFTNWNFSMVVMSFLPSANEVAER